MRITKIDIINTIRVILGIFFVLGGIGGLISGSFVAGFFIVLSGVALMPLIYKKLLKYQIAQQSFNVNLTLYQSSLNSSSMNFISSRT